MSRVFYPKLKQSTQSTEVLLPSDIAPKFPARCVVCGKSNRNLFVQMRGEPAGWYGVVKWIFGRSGWRRVPAHGMCAANLKIQLFWRQMVMLVPATLLVPVFFYLDISGVWMPMDARNMLVCSALIIVVPIIYWQMERPTAFEFRVGGSLTSYEFANESYAGLFAKLNKAAVKRAKEILRESSD